MKTVSFLILMLLITLSLNAQNNAYINKTIIVKLKQSTTNKSANLTAIDKIKQITKEELLEITPVFKNYNSNKTSASIKYNLSTIYKIELKTANKIGYYLQKINTLSNIEYAELQPIAEVFDTPKDPLIVNQYYLNNIKAFDAFNYSKGDTTIVIGIVDSGTDLLHEDLKDNYKYNYEDSINGKDDDEDGYIDNFYGWDMADNDPNPQSLVNNNGETNYHGTKVAGLASAVTNNAIGIASIGYKTKILPIKVMDSSGLIVAGYEGIVYAADHGCQIINCSWGSNSPSKFAQDVINYATLEKNCLVVAAAGNTGAAVDKRPDTWFYPASYNNVLSVAATGATDMRWSGSSYATTVDVSAPGEGIYSTRQFNTYGSGSGTSYAAPQVAGLAALLKAIKPEYSPKQLLEQIRITCDIIDTLSENVYYSKQLGYGRINAFKTLTIKDLPSVRLDSITIKSTKKSSLAIGDTLLVSFIATNYLAQVTNTTIRVSTNSDYIVPINNIFKTGKLGTFSSINNFEKPLIMEVKKEIPFNENVWFIFEMKDAGYDDYQIFEARINNNYIDISENNISTTLTSNGNIGYVDSAKNLGLGFIYNQTQSLLNYGGIIIANSDIALASSILEGNDFNTIKLIDTSRNVDNILIGKTEYATTPKTGLDIKISQTTLAPSIERANSMLIHLYSIKNETLLPVDGLKMSHFMDWDIYSNTQNQIGFVNDLNLTYTYSNKNEVIYTGICLLNDMESNPYAFDLVPGGNGGIDITFGFNNDLKWVTMNKNRMQAGNNGDSIDVASMLTTDFFNINANDSVEIAFAQIVSESYYDLINMAIAAREKYQFTAIKTNSSEAFKIYPNPAKNEIIIMGNETCKKVTIEIYDNSGILQFTKSYLNKKNISIDISGFQPGIYIVNYLTDKGKLVSKFIKTP